MKKTSVVVIGWIERPDDPDLQKIILSQENGSLLLPRVECGSQETIKEAAYRCLKSQGYNCKTLFALPCLVDEKGDTWNFFIGRKAQKIRGLIPESKPTLIIRADARKLVPEGKMGDLVSLSGIAMASYKMGFNSHM